MSYVPWYKRMEPITLGERFELDQFSTRAKTLSPTKSYAEKPTYNWEEGDWWDLDDQSVGNTKILEDFEITDEMRRRPNAAGGRIDMKPGGIVEPGVTHYARTAAEIKADAFRTGVPRKKLSDWTSEQRANLKTWMKNTGSTLEDFYKKPNDERFRIKRGHSLGVLQVEEPKKLANIKAWEKNTGLKFKDVKDPAKRTRIRTGATTGVQVGQLTEAEKAANIKAWEKYTGLKYKDLNKERQSGVRLGRTKGTRELMTASQSLEKSIWLKDYTS